MFMKFKLQGFIAILLIFFMVAGCGGDDNSNADQGNKTEQENNKSEEVKHDDGKGVGPISSVDLGDGIDQTMVETGKSVFELKCSACHKIETRHVGPALKGLTKTRKPEWMMNMMLNPEEMTKKDPEAKKLFGEYLIQMTFQNISEEDARNILEYLRSVDAE
jgi:cytochrome c